MKHEPITGYRFAIEGNIAFAEPFGLSAEQQRLRARYIRLLRKHDNCRQSAWLITRCPGLTKALDALRERIAA